mgnify:CR=1 FL=1
MLKIGMTGARAFCGHPCEPEKKKIFMLLEIEVKNERKSEKNIFLVFLILYHNVKVGIYVRVGIAEAMSLGRRL